MPSAGSPPSSATASSPTMPASSRPTSAACSTRRRAMRTRRSSRSPATPDSASAPSGEPSRRSRTGTISRSDQAVDGSAPTPINSTSKPCHQRQGFSSLNPARADQKPCQKTLKTLSPVAPQLGKIQQGRIPTCRRRGRGARLQRSPQRLRAAATQRSGVSPPNPQDRLRPTLTLR
jgi:hypothetical protein